MSLDQRFFTPDTGDTVFYPKRNQKWTVACVRGGYLSWCGWPEGMIEVERVELIAKATAREKLNLLQSWAQVTGHDHRAGTHGECCKTSRGT